MKYVILFLFSVAALTVTAQQSLSAGNNTPYMSKRDSLIREKILGLAMDNPAIEYANAQIKVAKIELKKARSSWLESIRLTGNINEFVVNNSPSANFFPKYNFGLNLPLNLFGNARNNANASREKIKMAETEKQIRERALRREVLIKYENYKEARELFELQKNITEGQLSIYKKAQKDYQDEVVKDINEVDKEYRKYMDEKLKQRTNEKELNIAIIELEELVGIRLEDVLKAVDESMR